LKECTAIGQTGDVNAGRDLLLVAVEIAADERG
jgi:hypothetical protein